MPVPAEDRDGHRPRNSALAPDAPEIGRFGQFGILLGDVCWLLGPERRLLPIVPALQIIGAACEVFVLVAVVRSLLSLVDGEGSFLLDIGPFSLDGSALRLLVFAAFAAVLAMLALLGSSVLIGHLAALASTSARDRLIAAYFAADWQQIRDDRVGNLARLLGPNAGAASNSVPLLSTTVTATVNLALYGVFVVVASPQVALAFVVVGAAVVTCFSRLRRRSRTLAHQAQDCMRDIQLQATSLVSIKQELQMYGVEGRAVEDLGRISHEASRAIRSLRIVQVLVPRLFQQVALLAIIGLIGLARALSVDATEFGVAAILALRSLSFLQQLNSSAQGWVEVAPYVTELRRGIDDLDLRRRRNGHVPLGPVERLQLRDVSFSYDGDVPAVNGIDLDLSSGARLGLVGPSGGGKTTLALLLAGLLDPSSGSYLVNGFDTRDIEHSDWSRRFALLSQEPRLLPGSIAENISFLRPTDETTIRRAASQAAIDVEVERRPDAWDTSIGDGGSSLSGGQKQRLALARALAGSPSVLILDEPSSALDAQSERLIGESLRNLGADTIVIVVSHRRALLQHCDSFAAIESGRIVATGDRTDVDVDRWVGRSADAG